MAQEASDRPGWVSTPQELVPFKDGWQIPRRFGADIPLRFKRREVICQVEGEMVNGTPGLVSLRVSDPLLPGELGRIRLGQVLGEAIRANLAHPEPLAIELDEGDEAKPWHIGDLMAAVNNTWDAEARQAARTGARRRLNGPFLREVAELYESGGVPAVVERHPAPERTVRRWLAKAKEVGLR